MTIEPKKVLLTEYFGNGKFAIALSTLASAPDFYIVRIDSKYKPKIGQFGDQCPATITSFMQESDDDVFEAIEREFGARDEDCDECGESRCSDCEFPAFDYDGCTYRAANADDLRGIDLEKGFSFCIVAAPKIGDGIRRDISGKIRSRPDAEVLLAEYCSSAAQKKYYKYFKIARHPFKPSIAGTGGAKVKRGKK